MIDCHYSASIHRALLTTPAWTCHALHMPSSSCARFPVCAIWASIRISQTSLHASLSHAISQTLSLCIEIIIFFHFDWTRSCNLGTFSRAHVHRLVLPLKRSARVFLDETGTYSRRETSVCAIRCACKWIRVEVRILKYMLRHRLLAEDLEFTVTSGPAEKQSFAVCC